MVKVINLTILNNNRLVLVRKEKKGKSSWILPGGKPENEESDLDCLIRELKEELPLLILKGSFSYYQSFNGVSPNRGVDIESRVYLHKTYEKLDLSVSKNSDEPIKEARLLTYNSCMDLSISDTTRKIINSLNLNHYF